MTGISARISANIPASRYTGHLAGAIYRPDISIFRPIYWPVDIPESTDIQYKNILHIGQIYGPVYRFRYTIFGILASRYSNIPVYRLAKYTGQSMSGLSGISIFRPIYWPVDIGQNSGLVLGVARVMSSI